MIRLYGERAGILLRNPHPALPVCPVCVPAQAGQEERGISARCGGLIEAGGQPGRLTYGRGFRSLRLWARSDTKGLTFATSGLSSRL